MLRKTMMLVPAALLGALPFAALADGLKQRELEQFNAATVTFSQASEAALKAHAGKLAAVEFDVDDGRAAYEAVVIGSDGKPWSVKIDAMTGEVFASALASDKNDHWDDD